MGIRDLFIGSSASRKTPTPTLKPSARPQAIRSSSASQVKSAGSSEYSHDHVVQFPVARLAITGAHREESLTALTRAEIDPVSDRKKLGDEILNYRAEVLGVVTRSAKDKCLVLDLGFNAAALIAVPEFTNTGLYETVKQTLTQSRSMTIAYERTVTHELFQDLFLEVQKLTSRAAQTIQSSMSEETRNLVLFNDLVTGAYQLGATDIHFTVSGDASQLSFVRLRIYGRMSSWKTLPTAHIKAALAAGYSSKSVPGTNSEPDWTVTKPCSTITKHEIEDSLRRKRGVSGRFTSRPTVDGGCKVSIRLLDTDVRDVRIPTLQELGYAPSHINDQLLPALRKNEGAILIAGGTGSGKSTTLRTFMHQLPDKERLERYSVEDPVEYVLPGVVQLSIQRSSDSSEETTRLQFTAALRDLMRMDPDAVMIGEIRDEETANLTTEMVNTGHRVLTTVHGNGNIDVLDRLTGKKLAVAPSTLGSGKFLLACMYQKLLPLLCPSCRKPAKGFLTPDQLEGVRRFGLDHGTLFVADEQGCDNCRLDGIEPTGTKGLTVVAEVMTPSREMLEHIRSQNWPAARDLWRSQRCSDFGDENMTGKTAFEHAVFKMSRGLIDINDIERDFEPLINYEIYASSEGGSNV